jgi:preprotein translocase subunit SecB
LREAEIEMLAVLVKDWSFANPCTPENVKKLLRNAPHVYQLVDETAGKRELFWTPPKESG